MSKKDGAVPYTDTRANDAMAELVGRAQAFWREKKGPITAAEITATCNAISGILQSWPV